MKKLIVSIAVITMLTSLSGCQTVNDNKGVATAKTEKETSSSAATKKIVNDQESNKVIPYIGMSKSDAMYKNIWGQPEKINNDTNMYTDEWIYKDGSILIFAGDKIQSIKSNIQPQIGMNKDQVLTSSWGQPEDINKTTNSSGTSEQWVYSGNRYLYFENGILQTIQE